MIMQQPEPECGKMTRPRKRPKKRPYVIIEHEGVPVAIKPSDLRPSDHVLAQVLASSPKGALIRYSKDNER